MGEMRQLLNIIEQLERKLGIDSGHINKLRMEKEGLYDELRKKTNTFDAWDSMMSSSLKTDGSSTAGPSISPPPAVSILLSFLVSYYYSKEWTIIFMSCSIMMAFCIGLLKPQHRKILLLHLQHAA